MLWTDIDGVEHPWPKVALQQIALLAGPTDFMPPGQRHVWCAGQRFDLNDDIDRRGLIEAIALGGTVSLVGVINYEDSKCHYGYMTVCDICKPNAPSHVNLDKRVLGFPEVKCEMCGREAQ